MAKNVEELAAETATATAATNVEDTKTKQVSTSLSMDEFNKLSDHRWDVKVPTVSAVLRIAAQEYIAKHGL